MIDKIATDARIYTDVQGLENLRYQAEKNPQAVKKEVSHQFEAIFMQMVMRSMRDANQALASGGDLFGGDQMELYQDMFDKQLSMLTADTGTGFAKIIETNIDNQYFSKQIAAAKDKQSKENVGVQNVVLKQQPELALKTFPKPSKPILNNKTTTESPAINSPQEFVSKLWTAAKTAASVLGTDPKILLAQAALETNWGKKILPHGKESSSFNLFNIKADNSWSQKTTMATTFEQQDGVIAKVKASFRSYNSYAESFKDYVNFLKQNNRYSEALSKVANPQQYIQALQKAGFATDGNYADKVLKIFSSNMFKKLIDNIE